MSAIEQCRSAALGGHVLRCDGCGTDQIAYNSCRNRHCPKCQSTRGAALARGAPGRPAAGRVLPRGLHAAGADRRHRVPEQGRDLRPAVRRRRRDAAAPSPPIPSIWARSIGATLVLHTWGSALTHHPHVHGIVPGGGLSPDGERWVACRPGFFLPVRVLSRLFRRRFLEELQQAHRAGQLQFFGEHAALADAAGVRAVARAAAQVRMGGLCQAAVRRARRRCWPTCRATRTAWRSPTAGCSRWTSAA